MLSKLICKLTDHVWDVEDFNEITPDMEIGDEAVLRCRRCKVVVVSIEKTRKGFQWNAHYPGAVLYEVTEKGKKAFGTEMLKRGAEKDLDKFREENK